MTRFETFKCVSCEVETTQPIKDEWLIIDNTHQLLCSVCGATIGRFTEKYLN